MLGVGLVAGVSIGVVVGAVTNNVGFRIAKGTGIGIVVGAAIATRRESQEGEESLQRHVQRIHAIERLSGADKKRNPAGARDPFLHPSKPKVGVSSQKRR